VAKSLVANASLPQPKHTMSWVGRSSTPYVSIL
jgi:hypothetical protein